MKMESYLLNYLKKFIKKTSDNALNLKNIIFDDEENSEISNLQNKDKNFIADPFFSES